MTVKGDGKLSTATLGDGNISAFAKSPNDAFSVGITVHDGAVVSKGDGSITAIAEAGQGTGYGLGIRAKGEGAKLDVGHDDVTVKVTGGLMMATSSSSPSVPSQIPAEASAWRVAPLRPLPTLKVPSFAAPCRQAEAV